MYANVSKNKAGLLIAILVMITLTSFFTHKTFFSVSGPVVVDYWAFATGVFLLSESLWRFLTSKEHSWAINLGRLLRIAAGICIFTIHLLQFLRDGKLGVE
jgi:hypothetical protein